MKRARPAAVAPGEREAGNVTVAQYVPCSYGLCCSHLQVSEVRADHSNCDGDTSYISNHSLVTCLSSVSRLHEGRKQECSMLIE